MRAVFRHELSGYFTTPPSGMCSLTMYALLSGLVFVFINIGQGNEREHEPALFRGCSCR